MNTDSLAVLLLTNRLVEVDAKPLAAGEIWKLLSRLPQIGLVLECSAETLVSDHGLEITEAEDGHHGVDEEDQLTAPAQNASRFGDPRVRIAPDTGAVLGDC